MQLKYLFAVAAASAMVTGIEAQCLSIGTVQSCILAIDDSQADCAVFEAQFDCYDAEAECDDLKGLVCTAASFTVGCDIAACPEEPTCAADETVSSCVSAASALSGCAKLEAEFVCYEANPLLCILDTFGVCVEALTSGLQCDSSVLTCSDATTAGMSATLLLLAAVFTQRS